MKNLKLFYLVLILLLISSISATESDKTYVFRIEQEGIYIRPINLNLFNAPFSEDSNLNNGNYKANLMDDKKTLYSVKFELYALSMANPTEECFQNPEDSSCQEELYAYEDSYADVILNFPYFGEANAIDVYSKEGFLFRFEFKNKTEPNFFQSYWYYFVGGGIILFLLILVIIKIFRNNKQLEVNNQYREF